MIEYVKQYLIKNNWVDESIKEDAGWGAHWKKGWKDAVLAIMTPKCGYTVLMALAHSQPINIPKDMLIVDPSHIVKLELSVNKLELFLPANRLENDSKPFIKSKRRR